MNDTAARTTRFGTEAGTAPTTPSSVPTRHGRARAPLARVVFTGAAFACLVIGRPGLASEPPGGPVPRASTLRVQADGGEGIRVPTAAFAIASADVDGFRRQAASVSSPLGTEAISERVAEIDPQARRESGSTVAEPATIAVLGFTAAALLGIRRRKTAAADTTLSE